jgi:hypothetical protein
MARVQYKSTPGGVLQRRNGDARPDVTIEHTGGTVYADATGATAYAGALKTNIDGEVPGWLDPGVYTTTDPTTGKSVTFEVGGIAGADTVPALTTRVTAVEGTVAVIEEAPINVRNPPGSLTPVVGDGTDAAAEATRLQALIDALPQTGGQRGGTLYVPARTKIALATAPNFASKSNVVVQGDGSGSGIYNASQLDYTGAGARAFDARSSNKLVFRGMDLRISNASFTGKIVDGDKLDTGADTAFLTLEHCRVGAAIQELGSATPMSAQCCVSLNNAIFFRSRDTYYQGAQRGIRGADPAAPGYSNGHLIIGGVFDHLPIYAIGNMDQGCDVIGVGFEGIEVGPAGSALYTIFGDDSGIARTWHGVGLEGGWVGDIGFHATKALIDLPATVTTRGLYIGGGIFLTSYGGINCAVRLKGPVYGLDVGGCTIAGMPHFDFGTAVHVGGKVSGCTFAAGGVPTTTTAAVEAGATTVPVVSTAAFASAGRAYGSANSATFDYTGKTATSFTGVTNLKLPIASGAGISQGGLTVLGWHNGHRGLTFEDNNDGVGSGPARSKVMRAGHQIAQRTPGEIPTIAVQAAAGSGATASLSAASNDICGRITLTTGTSATANGLHAIVTFGDAFNNEGGAATAPVVILQGRDATTAQWNSAVGTAMGSFRIDGVGLASSTTYTIDYYVIQAMG